MSVIDVKLDEANTACIVDERSRTTYTVPFKVMTNSRMGPKAVIDQSIGAASPDSVPAIGDTYDQTAFLDGLDVDANAYCKSISAQMIAETPALGANGQLWSVVAIYEPLDQANGEESGDFNADPLKRPFKFWIDREIHSELPTGEAESGRSMRGPLDESFEDAVEEDVSKPVLVAEWNIGTLQEVLDLTETWQGRINNSQWKSIAPHAALVREVSAGQKQVENGTEFFRVSFRVALRSGYTIPLSPGTDPNEVATYREDYHEDTWDQWLFLAGRNYRELDPEQLPEGTEITDPFSTVYVMNDNGTPVEKPFPNGEYKPLNPNGTIYRSDITGKTGWWKRFVTKPTLNFDNIPFHNEDVPI